MNQNLSHQKTVLVQIICVYSHVLLISKTILYHYYATFKMKTQLLDTYFASGNEAI